MFNGFFENAMWQLDQGVTSLVYQWNGWSTAIVTTIVMVLTYAVFSRTDPDTHPLILARQAQASPVRHPGQSSVYRSHSAPHGMPLNAGLMVKDPGASKWSRGRDGDIRDVWRQTVNGTSEQQGKPVGKGKILTVLGGEKVIENNLDDITRQINLIGKHILDQGGARVAIYLPNSVEFMTTLFACAFYNLTAILIPFDQSDDAVISMLRQASADTVVVLPGSFPFDTAVKNYPSLKNVVWVVDEGNRHMDWNEVPKGMGGKLNVATWQDIVQDSPADAGKELPPLADQHAPPDITVFWQSKPGEAEEMVEFKAANLTAAIAAQLFAIPQSQRMGPSDLFLPADALTNTYTLALTLAALYSNASVAFNTAAAGSIDLTLATRGIAPTVVVAHPKILLKTHEQAFSQTSASFLASKVHYLQTSSLTQSGIMPAASLLTSYNDSLRPAVGATPGKLRLVYTAERAGSSSETVGKLSSAVLSDLRIYLGARLIYALTAARVAGAVAQTQFYDYRVHEDKCSHFGPPVTSCEVLLKDSGEYRTTEEKSQGEIVVRGPAVAGGEAALGVNAYIRFDNTLAYV